jgi:hypothetical protein
MRALILFLIGLAFGGAGGFLAAGGLGAPAHDHAGHDDAGHDHSTLTEWQGVPPALSVALTRDAADGLNLMIAATGFAFAPERVDGPAMAGTGHAHVYVDGAKVARAYGPWMYLTGVPAGAVVRVTLNANDHTQWAIGGMPLASEGIAP